MAARFYQDDENFASEFTLNDFATQLEMFKVIYGQEDISVKYFDDENDEVGIENDDDLDYAYQLAMNSNSDNILRLVVRNTKGKVVAKPKLSLDIKSYKENKNQIQKKQQREKEMSKIPQLKTEKLQEKFPSDFTLPQLKWLSGYLENFKKEVLDEFEERIKSVIKSTAKTTKASSHALFLDDDKEMMDSFSFLNDGEQPNNQISFEIKIQKLLWIFLQAKTQERPLKCAYLEEELLSTGAFGAEFIKDYNVPDGSRMEPNTKFKKTWLIRNTGKLAWNHEKFPVKLNCIAGDLKTVNGEDYVNIVDTSPQKDVIISVDLVSPSKTGKYFSEWVLTCGGFRFGPRIWCSIEVNENDFDVNDESKNVMKESNESIKTLLKSTGSIKSSPLFNSNGHLNEEDLNPLNIGQARLDISRIDSLLTTTPNEDLESEFVVVPDCFDLTKKWKSLEHKSDEIKNSKDLQSSSSSSSISNAGRKRDESFSNKDLNQTSDISFLNIEDDKDHEDNHENVCPSFVKEIQEMNKNGVELGANPNLLILSFGNDNKKQKEAKQPLPSSSTTESKNDETETIVNLSVATSSNSDIQVITPRSYSCASYDHLSDEIEEKSIEQNNKDEIKSTIETTEADHLSAYDLVKNAFSSLSNMGGPSFANPNFDLLDNPSKSSSKSNSSEYNFDDNKVELADMLIASKLLATRCENKNRYQNSRRPITKEDELVEMGFTDRKLNATLLKKYRQDINKVVGKLVGMNKSDKGWFEKNE